MLVVRGNQIRRNKYNDELAWEEIFLEFLKLAGIIDISKLKYFLRNYISK